MAIHLVITNADGTPVTAQGAYNAFMNTRVLIVKDGTTYEATSMEWYDNNSTQDDPTNVGYVSLNYVKSSSEGFVSLSNTQIGDRSLVPK